MDGLDTEPIYTTTFDHDISGAKWSSLSIGPGSLGISEGVNDYIGYDNIRIYTIEETIENATPPTLPASGIIVESDFESFEDGLASCGGAILSRNVFVDEVTDYYYDTEARLKSLQTQEDQLMKLLEKADKLEVIIQLQNELSNVRYQIESMQGTLRRLDSQVAYSTVTINVREVYESTAIQAPPKTLGQRIAYTFSNTWDNIVDGVEDFVVFVAGNILLLVFWGAIIAVVITIVVRRIRRRKIRKTVIKPETEDESND
jgi:hypothetical protein